MKGFIEEFLLALLVVALFFIFPLFIIFHFNDNQPEPEINKTPKYTILEDGILAIGDKPINCRLHSWSKQTKLYMDGKVDLAEGCWLD